MAQPKGEAHALPRARVARERRKVVILLGSCYLPIACVSVQCGEHPGIHLGFNALIHSDHGVRILDYHQFQLSVFMTEACRAIRRRHHKDWASPFSKGEFYNPHRVHALGFGFLSLPGKRLGLVGMLPQVDGPGLQPNSVIHTAYQHQVTPPKGGMIFQEGLDCP